MNFGEQIKKVRKDRNLTQQDMAEKLGISRQAVSNWENDKNLPDIEMLISMSRVFHLTLDELILGGTEMNNMTEKLIKDGSENARIKMNLLGIKIGGILLVLSFISLIAGILAPVNIEGYFGTAFTAMMFCGVLAFLIVGIKNMMDIFRKQAHKQQNGKLIATGGLLVLIGIVVYCLSLVTEKISCYLGFAGIALGIILIVVGTLTSQRGAEE
ncbi:MAG: helix-turn-helix domain-containing protein [Oscillibacter sp.]|nr:helix-turn-helix domain-containing protein [Oscillibacter sp.]